MISTALISFREICGGHFNIMQSGNVWKKSKVSLIKYWLRALFSWFNKPLVMHQFLPLHSCWTCLSPEGSLPPSKPARYQLAFVKKKKGGGNSTGKGQHRSHAKNDICCSHRVFLKVTLHWVYGFTPIRCVLTEHAEGLRTTCPFPSWRAAK